MAGSDDFDTVTEGISLLAPLATDGLLLDMNEISTMKLFTNICGQSRWAQGTFTSRYESMEKKAQKQIDDYIEMIEELD